MTEPQPPPLQADSPTALSRRPGRRAVPAARGRGRGLRGGPGQRSPGDPGAGGGGAGARRHPRDAVALGTGARLRRETRSVSTRPTMLGVSAVGGNGSLLQALDQGIQQINDMIAGLAATPSARYRDHRRRTARGRAGFDVKCAAPCRSALHAPARRLRVRARRRTGPDRLRRAHPDPVTRRHRQVAQPPCGALTGDQLAGVGLEPSPGASTRLATGVHACVWEDSDFTRDASASPSTPTRDFLVDTYRSRRLFQRLRANDRSPELPAVGAARARPAPARAR